MKIRDEFLKRISYSTDALVAASLRQIDQWMRDGLSFEEILARLKTLRLPSAQAAQLQATLDKTMDDIIKARAGVVGELSQSDINVIKSASWISMSRLQKDLQAALIPTVQRAIAAEIGPRALSHQLRALEIKQPETLAFTSLSQFNNGLTIAQGQQVGTAKYKWDGPAPIINSHLLCKKCAGQTFSLAELDMMDNGTGMPVRLSLGGYNCRHHLTAQV